MASAGYDPHAALDLWDLMTAVEADAVARGSPVSVADKFSLLQTHPPSHTRQDVGDKDMRTRRPLCPEYELADNVGKTWTGSEATTTKGDEIVSRE